MMDHARYPPISMGGDLTIDPPVADAGAFFATLRDEKRVPGPGFASRNGIDLFGFQDLKWIITRIILIIVLTKYSVCS